LFPRQRSLVQEFKDKPFALVGVNSDDKDRLKGAIKRQNMTWRSFWDGGDTFGPITTKWNVHSWPTMILLDKKGTLRFIDIKDNELNDAIVSLLDE
jgi:hypothetical protein